MDNNTTYFSEKATDQVNFLPTQTVSSTPAENVGNFIYRYHAAQPPTRMIDVPNNVQIHHGPTGYESQLMNSRRNELALREKLEELERQLKQKDIDLMRKQKEIDLNRKAALLGEYKSLNTSKESKCTSLIDDWTTEDDVEKPELQYGPWRSTGLIDEATDSKLSMNKGLKDIKPSVNVDEDVLHIKPESIIRTYSRRKIKSTSVLRVPSANCQQSCSRGSSFIGSETLRNGATSVTIIPVKSDEIKAEKLPVAKELNSCYPSQDNIGKLLLNGEKNVLPDVKQSKMFTHSPLTCIKQQTNGSPQFTAKPIFLPADENSKELDNTASKSNSLSSDNRGFNSLISDFIPKSAFKPIASYPVSDPASQLKNSIQHVPPRPNFAARNSPMVITNRK